MSGDIIDRIHACEISASVIDHLCDKHGGIDGDIDAMITALFSTGFSMLTQSEHATTHLETILSQVVTQMVERGVIAFPGVPENLKH